jgi:hypothetical protein
LRHQRAASLMMPMLAPAGGGGGGSSSDKRRPGNWLVGGFDPRRARSSRVMRSTVWYPRGTSCGRSVGRR